MAEYVDKTTSEYYKNCGFEREKGAYRKACQMFLASMYAANSKSEMDAAYRQVRQEFQKIPLNKPLRPLRVGMIGEFYTAMDSFSNLEVERKLADMGVDVHRWLTVTNRFLYYSGEKNLNVRIRDLCTYEMGPTSTANIWCAWDYAERGFDGLIHIKSANCTPEIKVRLLYWCADNSAYVHIKMSAFDK